MSRREEFSEAAQRHWGTNDIESMFPEDVPIAGVPWRSAARSKSRQDYDPDIVRKALVDPSTEITDIDPRGLKATQPRVTRAGVHYYLNDDRYQRTGETFADRGNLGNQWPTVYRRPTMADPAETEDVLLSGHHRAAADLLKGRPTRGRLIEGPWGPPRRRGSPPS